MLVSLRWLADFVELPASHAELAQRLAFAGLNHEGTDEHGDDTTLDLEITSNRPDCLGHIGVAREIATLYDRPLNVKDPRPLQAGPPLGGVPPAGLGFSVEIASPDLCRRYTARLVRGVKIGPSAPWLIQRLAAVGMPTINNVVDITNYVLMECGQPLHAFDFAEVRGGKIIVREALPGEPFEAIDHRTYELRPGICVIADAERAVALAGVMGGANSEISEATTDVLIEAADFSQLAVRAAARALNLHSPSSYRFERGMDPEGVDWASRRCCELILELAGGKLSAGMADAGQPAPQREPITLRFAQIERLLGYEIPAEEVTRILGGLGLRGLDGGAPSPNPLPQGEGYAVLPPSWRKDLTREIDLIEEVARVYGYDKAPPATHIKLTTSARREEDRTLDIVRRTMNSLGYFEAVTASVVDEATDDAFHPFSDAPPLATLSPMLRGADRLRRSVAPSLLVVLKTNESLGNEEVRLFETARAYAASASGLADEWPVLSIVSNDDYFAVKGVIETLLGELRIAAELEIGDYTHPSLAGGRAVRLSLAGALLGYLGELSETGREAFALRGDATLAELRFDVLHEHADLTPQAKPISPYPAVEHDVNLIVDEAVRWADLAAAARQGAGDELVAIDYRETYRNAAKDGPGKKRLLLTLTFQADDRTLTSEEAEAIRDRAVAACAKTCGAELLAG